MDIKLKDFFTWNDCDSVVNIDENVFNCDVNSYVVSLVLHWQMAKARSGNHSIKNRSEINATTKKAFRQKGTGAARRGAKSTNILRGGGVSHGPVVRSHAYHLQKKVRKLGLKSAISMKFKSDKLFFVDDFDLAHPKTKDLKNALSNNSIKSALIIDTDKTKNIITASNNLHSVRCLHVDGLNVRDILSKDILIISKSSINAIEQRFQGKK